MVVPGEYPGGILGSVPAAVRQDMDDDEGALSCLSELPTELQESLTLLVDVGVEIMRCDTNDVTIETLASDATCLLSHLITSHMRAESILACAGVRVCRQSAARAERGPRAALLLSPAGVLAREHVAEGRIRLYSREITSVAIIISFCFGFVFFYFACWTRHDIICENASHAALCSCPRAHLDRPS